MVLWHINYCWLFKAKSILHILTVQLKTIQFYIHTLFSSIWPIDRTLSVASTPGQSEPGSNGNGVLCNPQSSIITGKSPLDCLVLYQDIRRESLTPLQICSRCILQAKSTGPQDIVLNIVTISTGSVLQMFFHFQCQYHLTEIEVFCAWGLEFTDFIASKKKWCPKYDAKHHLILRLLFWRSGECGISFFLIRFTLSEFNNTC